MINLKQKQRCKDCKQLFWRKHKCQRPNKSEDLLCHDSKSANEQVQTGSDTFICKTCGEILANLTEVNLHTINKKHHEYTNNLFKDMRLIVG